MRRMLGWFVLFSFLWASVAHAQGLGGLLPADYGARLQNVKVNSFAQVGFLRMGSNISLPIGAELVSPDIGSVQIGTMELTVEDANFWNGTVGFTVTASEMFSFSGSAGGCLPRQFVATGQIPVDLGGAVASPTIDFTASRLDTWYVQGGIGLGPILGGVYYNYFTIDFGEPRQGSVPFPNQTLRGVLISKTLVPYVGFTLPAYGAVATILYSPLALSDTTLDLRSSANRVSQLQYKWKKPGNFISSTVQYNMPVSGSSSFGLWINYTWLNMRGNAELEFAIASPFLLREKEVTATLTQYAIQGGVTLGVTF